MNATEAPPSELLSGDHRELDQRFEEFKAIPASDTGQRREQFDRFANELRRHIAVEERLLFPIFGEGDPSRRALVERMLDEHRQIEGALGRIRRGLDEAAVPTEGVEFELVNVLWAHNALEEGAVYPWFDSHLSSELSRTVQRELRDSGPAQAEPPSGKREA